MIIPLSHQKGLKALIKEGKVGLNSKLWTENLNNKLEFIIKTKFDIISKKLTHFLINLSKNSSIVEIIREEIKEEKAANVLNFQDDLKYFKNFTSSKGIIKDNWDSDYDVIDEANKKSPIIMVIGPPLIGKSAVCKKLAEELKMVYLHPQSFIDKINEKEAQFELKLEELANDVNPDDVDENGEPKPKDLPKIDTVLTEVELMVYNDLTQRGCLSEKSMIEVYKSIIFSGLAHSRGLIIEHSTAIEESNEYVCFIQ